MKYYEGGKARAVPRELSLPFHDHETMAHYIAKERRKAERKNRCLGCGETPMRGYALCYRCRHGAA